MSRNRTSRTVSQLQTRLAAFLITCGLLAAAGCGGQTGDDKAPGDETTVSTYALEDTAHTRNVRVYDNVKRLDVQAAEAVYIDDNTLFFPADVADALDKYEPGDIMATSAGKGLLRKVNSIERQGDSIIVQTSPASLSQVFASGEIYVATHAQPDLTAPESFRYEALAYDSDLNTRQQGLGFEKDWSGSLFSWNRDFAPELNTKIQSQLGTDRLVVDEASVSVDVGGEFYADAGATIFPPSFELRTLRVGANGQANATLRVSVVSDDAFDFQKTYYLASTDPAHQPFKQLSEQSFDVAGLIQLNFSGHSKLDLSASVDGTVRATGEVQVNGNIRGGLERKNGTWKTYSDAGLSPSGYAPDFSGQKSFDANATLTTILHVDVADAATGSLTVEPATVTADFMQQINASNGQCPYLFNINVKGEVTGQLEKLSVLGFDIDIMDSPSSWTMYDRDFMTTEGQVELPGVCDPNWEPPSFGDGGRSGGMMCQEDSDCDGASSCYRNTCVTDGPIRFSVAWFEDTDVDIQVTTPSGEVVDWRSYAHGGRDGLTYDFPMCTGKCFGPGPYVESIYSEDAPQSGKYIVEVVHHDARAQGDFALLIFHDGQVRHEGGTLPAEGESVSFEYTVK